MNLAFEVGGSPLNIARKEIGSSINILEGPIETLVPLTKVASRPNSLSRKVGRSEQPPHTDGAHKEMPPAFVLLWTEKSSGCQAPTHIRVVDSEKICPEFWEEFRRSVWSVKTTSSRFHYRKCVGKNQSVRWDSACFVRCVVGNLTSKRVDAEFKKISKFVFRWSPGKALLLNNRQVLHGRCDATNPVNDNRIMKRVSFYES